MARKVRFPLEMNDGIEVRDLESLRQHFSVSKVVEYFKNGKLIIWLRDRYANDLAEALEQINPDDSSLVSKICEVFDIEFDEMAQEEMEKATERAKRIERLREITDEDEYLKNIDLVAFDQDELYDLLDEEQTVIYLCGGRFSVPLAQSGVTYIGINKPTVKVDSKVEVDWKKKNILLKNIKFDEKYNQILKEKRRRNEKRDKQVDDNLQRREMFCVEDNNIYRLIDNKFELFYQAREFAIFRGVIWDDFFVYFIRQKELFGFECDIVRINIQTKNVEHVVDLERGVILDEDLLGVRKNLLFLQGRCSNRDKITVVDIEKKTRQTITMNISDVKQIFLDEMGENLYVYANAGRRSWHYFYEYCIKTKQTVELFSVYDVRGISLVNNHLYVCGMNDTYIEGKHDFVVKYDILSQKYNKQMVSKSFYTMIEFESKIIASKNVWGVDLVEEIKDEKWNDSKEIHSLLCFGLGGFSHISRHLNYCYFSEYTDEIKEWAKHIPHLRMNLLNNQLEICRRNKDQIRYEKV